LKYGLIPEFVGRLPVVATLEDLKLQQVDAYFYGLDMADRDATAWLTMQSAANLSPHQIPC
jgi:hypothetical protein